MFREVAMFLLSHEQNLRVMYMLMMPMQDPLHKTVNELKSRITRTSEHQVYSNIYVYKAKEEIVSMIQELNKPSWASKSMRGTQAFQRLNAKMVNTYTSKPSPIAHWPSSWILLMPMQPVFADNHFFALTSIADMYFHALRDYYLTHSHAEE